MRKLDEPAVGGRAIDRFDSVGASVRGISRRVLQVVFIQVGSGGRVGRHPTSCEQLFLVVTGTGWVSGGDGERAPLSAGEAVVWEAGEEHESGSEEGMTALVVEAERLDV
jgi:quercetin dioxygenase-like cupin family protein